MSKQFLIKNSEGDFLQVQNYVLQLVSEKKVTQSAFILYCFYKSLAGFTEIKCGYDYISLNSGLSKGSITNGNKILEKFKLITIKNNGYNNPFEIILTLGAKLPRRALKKIDRPKKCVQQMNEELRSADEHHVQQMNAGDALRSADEQINIYNKYSLYKYNTTAASKALENKSSRRRTQYHSFLDAFSKHWCNQYNVPNYIKNDFKILLDIDDIDEAVKYIPVLWSIDEADKWIKNSDHSLSIFAKEYKSGRLQAYYPQTKHFYKEKQKIIAWNKRSP